ncbi:uncharacterized protein [Pseudorca crassidens]|uniref:uncharacterized protein n=1 Tax=Pseudorca crassidens TaxID=82174 RepID=UPI00352F3182
MLKKGYQRPVTGPGPPAPFSLSSRLTAPRQPPVIVPSVSAASGRDLFPGNSASCLLSTLALLATLFQLHHALQGRFYVHARNEGSEPLRALESDGRHRRRAQVEAQGCGCQSSCTFTSCFAVRHRARRTSDRTCDPGPALRESMKEAPWTVTTLLPLNSPHRTPRGDPRDTAMPRLATAALRKTGKREKQDCKSSKRRPEDFTSRREKTMP